MRIFQGFGVAFGLLATTPGFAQAPLDSLTVEQCVALARGHAPDVMAAAAMQGAARADSIATGFNRRPALSLNGGALVAPRGFYDPVVTNLGEYQLKIAAEWPLLGAGARARERSRAALEAAAATGDLAQAAREAGRRAAAVALDALRQSENERSQTDALAWLDRLADMLQPAVRAGARTRADAMRVDLERSTVAAALLETRRMRVTLERELVELVGRLEQARVAVIEPGAEAETPLASPDSTRLLERAATTPSVHAAEIEEARQRVAIQEARRRNALQFGLIADAGLAGADLTSPVPEDLRASNPDATFSDRLRRDLGASVAVQVKRPIADPAARSILRAREESLRAATLRRETALARARREVLDLLDRGRTATDRSQLAREAAGRADENLLRLRSLYAAGDVGLLELLDARRQLDEARERLADARFEARQAHFEAEIP
jgi:outer membrane protein TolC